MRLTTRYWLALNLTVALLITACGGSSFARQLRLVLAASPPLIESLPLSPALKSGLITDFTSMADNTATLAECLSAVPDKPAKLTCVQSYQLQIEAVIAHGNFGNANHPRLNQILSLLRGIIASARIYYGGTAADTRTVGVAPERVTEDSIKRQIKELEVLIKAR